MDITEVTLKNGQKATLQMVRPEDKNLFLEGFSHLSEETKRQRFLGPKKELSPKELDFYSSPDDYNHIAYSVCIREPKAQGLGVARLVRLTKDGPTAELGILIVDKYQGQGIGSILMEAIIKRAKEVGIKNITGLMNNTNTPMIGLLKKFKIFEFQSAGEGLIEIKGTISI
ncbi:acetyltransferase, GNAT family [Bacteriovorax sp. BSW11_IV]|uniref:GNAT family N-acetyltransferase n=1 Tax=Bacteriovorax sp. BSW11_IV TaxID=1353529 RepID=UPI000389FBFA|nr:GNAT family N-acetyltransferase [Bacteriovorax sp. BSW11_IV]EQC49190.1 acetyltransferase, GNAT family [Bacteriovorax sp. BSW11_IV]